MYQTHYAVVKLIFIFPTSIRFAIFFFNPLFIAVSMSDCTVSQTPRPSDAPVIKKALVVVFLIILLLLCSWAVFLPI